MFWIITGAMLAAAVLVVAVPLYRAQKRLTVTSISSIVAIAAIAAVVYSQTGAPDADLSVEPQAGELPNIEEMVASLAARLQENPDDLAGWQMLGRSYAQMQNFTAAVAAFERANEIEGSQNGQTLADLGEAILMSDPESLQGRAGQLFENALALMPSNPKALFYSGMAAARRGDNALAADRWEALLATSPPQNIQDILRQRIAELRGVDATPPPVPTAAPGSVVNVSVSLGEAALNAGLPDSTVFIIARDPNQPSPPIAAVRRRLSELPAEVPIGDSDAMIPGRVPSGFGNLEIIARVSLSGQPIAQPGDWFGSKIVQTDSANSVQIVIDQQEP